MDFVLDTCGRRRGLLLIFIFVLKAAANCPKPEGKDNAVLTQDSLLMNEFPEGSVITLECIHGYRIESGDDKISCTGGQWTEPELICKKKDCGPPKPKPFMKFDLSNGTLFGALIKVFCEKGYDITGVSYRQCLGTSWSGSAKCEIVICEVPPTVANGMTLWESQDDPEYGQEIGFACDEGYTLVGPQRIVCNEIGEYDRKPPTCEGVTTGKAITTRTVPTPPPQTQAVSTSTATSATSTAQEDKSITASATPSVSPSAGGARDTFTAEGNATTASVNSTTSFQDDHDEVINTQASTRYLPATIAVLCAVLFAAVLGCFIYKSLLRRKGSYDTREDQKPELLQFQNL